MRTDEAQPNSVQTYFETQVYPEIGAAKKAAEKKRDLHNFVPDSRRHRRNKTETPQTRWDCGCVTTLSPNGTTLRSPCGADDCLYDRGMARIVT